MPTLLTLIKSGVTTPVRAALRFCAPVDGSRREMPALLTRISLVFHLLLFIAAGISISVWAAGARFPLQALLIALVWWAGAAEQDAGLLVAR